MNPIFDEASPVTSNDMYQSECDGTCGCVVPCSNCKGHHHENETLLHVVETHSSEDFSG